MPQCLAYAMLSGLPPMYGLVTAAVPGIIAALLGKSRFVTVGPTNTTGLIILTSLSPWAGDPNALLTAMATLGFMAGLMRLVIVVSRTERIFDFVPEAVMVGFATGAAVIIGVMQLDETLGQPFEGVSNVLEEFIRLLDYSLPDVNFASFLLAFIALISVILGKRFFPRWPIPLIVLICSMALVHFSQQSWVLSWATLGKSGLVSEGWPQINSALPSLSMIQQLIIPSFAVAFIGSLELIVTLRNSRSQHLLASELKSQGIANIVGSFAGAFPASTSLTRSVMLEVGGAMSRWAPFIAALVMVPILIFGASAISAIPQPVIAGLLIAIAISMIKPAQIKQMLRGNHQTRMLFISTFLSTLMFDFHIAILVGTLLGIGLFLFQTSKPQIFCYELDEHNQAHPVHNKAPSRLLIQISGSLYFAAARQLPNQVNERLVEGTQQCVIDLSHAHQCRVAAIQALQEIEQHCVAQGIDLKMTGASTSLQSLCSSLNTALPWSNDQLSLILQARS
ncbi:SulP family inorganic anion transporter [Reinekea marina]|nr:SulP family inorganic anion transporter [Reinekea marina]MDN3649084.1 SulP family inorganic anion transporter [Reinekea marina]